jgi:hypothetical protein
MPGLSKPASGRTPRLGLLAALGGLVLVLLVCLLVILVSPGMRSWLPLGSASGQTPTQAVDSSPVNPADTPGPPSPTLPEAAGTLVATLEPTPVFLDDFSSPANGWPQSSTAQGGYAYLDGTYSISVQRNGDLFWAAPDGSYADLEVQVEAGRAAGDQGYYGVLCRIQDADNYYYFIIRPDSYFAIGKFEDGSFSALTPGGWTYHRAIRAGDAVNHLQAECAGNQLRLSANGELLGEVRDRTFESGRSGLIAAALDERGFQAVFDNFAIFSADR